MCTSYRSQISLLGTSEPILYVLLQRSNVDFVIPHSVTSSHMSPSMFRRHRQYVCHEAQGFPRSHPSPKVRKSVIITFIGLAQRSTELAFSSRSPRLCNLFVQQQQEIKPFFNLFNNCMFYSIGIFMKEVFCFFLFYYYHSDSLCT